MIIGIDPGFTGAITFMYPDGKLSIHDLPVKLVCGKKQIDAVHFNMIVATKNAPRGTKFAIIEDVGPMPGQGIVSTSRFTYNAGILLGVLAGNNITIYKVRPSVWKPGLGLSKNKKDSLDLAKKLFPDYSNYFRLAKHDGRAEATLIAYYAKKHL